MNKRRQRKPFYSLERNIKVLVYIAIPVIVINIIVSLFSIVITRQQTLDYISDTIRLYQNETQTKIVAVEHFVRWSSVNEPLIETIEGTQDYGKYINAISTFRTRVSDNQYATGQEFQYFLSLNKQDLFLNCSSLQLSYSNYLIVKKYFLNLMTTNQIIQNSSKWKTLKIQDNYYFYYLIHYYNRTFITLISAEDMINPLKNINLGTNGFIIMRDIDGKQLTNSTLVAEAKKYEGSHLLLNHLVFDKENSKLPFTLDVYVDNFGTFERIVLLQIIVILMAFIVALTLFTCLFYMHSKVIKPIQEFSNNLSNINEHTNLIDLQSSNIIELEQANTQFKNLMSEVKKLKINIYEQELDKKRIQIAFMQQQIKPHFYLNCLTTIYSMAQTQLYKEIEAMALSTAKYLRYLFQTNKDFVKLEYELNHINDYLCIQSLRYGSAFSYECHIAPSLEQAQIPPLVLITFIENSIKYGVSLESPLKITLSIHKYTKSQKDYLYILLTDTGPGFSPNVLEQLRRHQLLVSEDGTHIGISNIIQRLSFLYDEDYELNFSNQMGGGARVELIILLTY